MRALLLTLIAALELASCTDILGIKERHLGTAYGTGAGPNQDGSIGGECGPGMEGRACNSVAGKGYCKTGTCSLCNAPPGSFDQNCQAAYPGAACCDSSQACAPCAGGTGGFGGSSGSGGSTSVGPCGNLTSAAGAGTAGCTGANGSPCLIGATSGICRNGLCGGCTKIGYADPECMAAYGTTIGCCGANGSCTTCPTTCCAASEGQACDAGARAGYCRAGACAVCSGGADPGCSTAYGPGSSCSSLSCTYGGNGSGGSGGSSGATSCPGPGASLWVSKLGACGQCTKMGSEDPDCEAAYGTFDACCNATGSCSSCPTACTAAMEGQACATPTLKPGFCKSGICANCSMPGGGDPGCVTAYGAGTCCSPYDLTCVAPSPPGSQCPTSSGSGGGSGNGGASGNGGGAGTGGAASCSPDNSACNLSGLAGVCRSSVCSMCTAPAGTGDPYCGSAYGTGQNCCGANGACSACPCTLGQPCSIGTQTGGICSGPAASATCGYCFMASGQQDPGCSSIYGAGHDCCSTQKLCAACTGVTCTTGNDCASGVCFAGACLPARCNDGVKNGSETDVDCGGGACASCPTGKMCQANTDCFSDSCSAGVCLAAGACGPPSPGPCWIGGQTGGLCEAQICMTCSAAPGSTDPNCASIYGTNQGCCSAQGLCTLCTGVACSTASSCASGVCNAPVACQAPTCTDRVRNGNETDVDCGGGTCPACPAARACKLNTDCGSGTCIATTTAPYCDAPASCSNGTKDGTETATDCGGGVCPPCGPQKACAVASDCWSSVCQAGFTCQ